MPFVIGGLFLLGIAALALNASGRGSGPVVRRVPPQPTPQPQPQPSTARPVPPPPPQPPVTDEDEHEDAPAPQPSTSMTQRTTSAPSAKGGAAEVTRQQPAPPQRPPVSSAPSLIRVTPYTGPGVSRPPAPTTAPRGTSAAPSLPPSAPQLGPSAPSQSYAPPSQSVTAPLPSQAPIQPFDRPPAPPQPEIRPLTEAELAARHAVPPSTSSAPRPSAPQATTQPEIRPLTDAELAARHAPAPRIDPPVQPGTPLPDPPSHSRLATHVVAPPPPSGDEVWETADGTRVNMTQSHALASQVASAVRAHGPRGATELVQSFQVAAGLFPADGIYGGATREALVFFGVPDAPATTINPHGRYSAPVHAAT